MLIVLNLCHKNTSLNIKTATWQVFCITSLSVLQQMSTTEQINAAPAIDREIKVMSPHQGGAPSQGNK
jgi:hypothetical protein